MLVRPQGTGLDPSVKICENVIWLTLYRGKATKTDINRGDSMSSLYPSSQTQWRKTGTLNCFPTVCEVLLKSDAKRITRCQLLSYSYSYLRGNQGRTILCSTNLYLLAWDLTILLLQYKANYTWIYTGSILLSYCPIRGFWSEQNVLLLQSP